ncbi:hypothetical protein ACFYNY_20735 [Streptomyces sp. NPDC006530]|uniref:hypothetical protein n=1 Tax=Streptomyces sp. NPDC006530 TaxID=3364750 RepID=UPI0036B19478
MTDYDTYGTNSHTVDELVRLLGGGRLGLVFTEHDSYYRGVYHRADSSDGEIEIQPNSIPGSDDKDDLYAAEHPTMDVLLLILTSAPVSDLRAQLNSIEGLVHLQHESL